MIRPHETGRCNLHRNFVEVMPKDVGPKCLGRRALLLMACGLVLKSCAAIVKRPRFGILLPASVIIVSVYCQKH